jgi:RNA polymerase sigma factor (sigma-70 family)
VELGSATTEATASTPPSLRVVRPATYEGVYRAEYARMVRVARLLVGSKEAAEDIAQDAFVKLYPRFETVADPSGYLYRTVLNACWSRHRHWRVVERVRHLTERDEADYDEIDETRDELKRLRPRHRAVVVLRYYADLPLADIADILGVTTGTVKSMLHRALAELRQVVER